MIRRALFHNFHFVLALDRWVSRRFSKSGMLVLGGLVMAAVFGIDTRQTVAYQLFSLLLVLLLFSLSSNLFFRPGLSVQRILPRFATVGEPFQYHLHLYNQSDRAWQSLLAMEVVTSRLPDFEEFMVAREPGHASRNRFDRFIGYPRWVWLTRLHQGVKPTLQPLPFLPSQTTVVVKRNLTPLRRGYIHFSHLLIARPDPFGLSHALHYQAVPDRLLVLPQRYPVQAFSLPTRWYHQRGGTNLARSAGGSEDFFSLRDYRPGDPLRHIHWRSWAHVGKLVVKEFQDNFFTHHALVLDTFTELSDRFHFEAAVSAAASLVCAPHSHDTLINLMFTGNKTYSFPFGRGPGQSDQLLEVLACVEPEVQSFEKLYAMIRTHAASLSGCICILLDWDESRASLLNLLRQANVTLLPLIIQGETLTQMPPSEIKVIACDDLAAELANLFT